MNSQLLRYFAAFFSCFLFALGGKWQKLGMAMTSVIASRGGSVGCAVAACIIAVMLQSGRATTKSEGQQLEIVLAALQSRSPTLAGHII